MINNIFPLPIQNAIQAPVEGIIVTPFESAALWIDDVIVLYIFGY